MSSVAPALLQTAETVLIRSGVEQLTLRAVAREEGVSHTASQHHFGDLTGLLSELAAAGFVRFRTMMLESALDAQGLTTTGRALGRGYLRFARNNPDLFLLMFRSGRLDMRRPALASAVDAAFAVLAGGTAGRPFETPFSLTRAAQITSNWAFVHGLAMLSIDKRLSPIVAALNNGSEDDLLEEALGFKVLPSI
jgi:AcrR family transcriptional regulator